MGMLHRQCLMTIYLSQHLLSLFLLGKNLSRLTAEKRNFASLWLVFVVFFIKIFLESPQKEFSSHQRSAWVHKKHLLFSRLFPFVGSAKIFFADSRKNTPFATYHEIAWTHCSFTHSSFHKDSGWVGWWHCAQCKRTWQGIAWTHCSFTHTVAFTNIAGGCADGIAHNANKPCKQTWQGNCLPKQCFESVFPSVA